MTSENNTPINNADGPEPHVPEHDAAPVPPMPPQPGLGAPVPPPVNFAQPVPPQPIPAQPIPAQPGQPYGGQPAQPMPAQPIPAQPMFQPGQPAPYGQPQPSQQGMYGQYTQPKPPTSDFVLALQNIIPTLQGIHKDAKKTVRDNQQYSAWWWVMLLVFSLLFGLASATLVARFPNISAGSFINRFSSSFGMGNMSPYSVLTFGYWFLCYFVFTLLTALLVLARAALVKATASFYKQEIKFTEAANFVATGLVLPSFAIAALFVISLLPIPVLTGLLVAVLLVFFFGGLFMSELMTHEALDDFTKTEKSTAYGFAVGYWIWMFIMFLVLLVCSTIVGHSVASSIMSMFW